jgi:hypothetical protein
MQSTIADAASNPYADTSGQRNSNTDCDADPDTGPHGSRLCLPPAHSDPYPRCFRRGDETSLSGL